MLRYVGCFLFVSLVNFKVEARTPPKPIRPPILPPSCGPECRMFCPNGFVIDNRGCQKCECIDGPIKPCIKPYCPKIKCAHGFATDKNGCETCKCNPAPIKPCSPPYCPRMKCTHGFATDAYGCETCKCKPGPILPPVIKKCPAYPRKNIKCYPAITANSCVNDADCYGGKICCLSGCNKTCVHPK